jgi:hypothetical protein
VPKPKVIAIVLAAAAVLVLAALVLGDFGDDPLDAEVPSDYQSADLEGLQFAYPADWEGPELSDTPNGGTEAVYLGPLGDDGFGPALKVLVLPEGGSGFDGFVDGSRDSIEVLRGDDSQITSEEEVEVPGAVEAVLIESDYEQELAGERPVAARSFDLLVLGEDGKRYRLIVRAAREGGDFDPATILSSVELEGE